MRETSRATLVERVVRHLKAGTLQDRLLAAYWRRLGAWHCRAARSSARRRIRGIVGSLSPETVVVIVKSTLDYRCPVWQRPHHLSRALAATGACTFYVPRGTGFDRVSSVEQVQANLYLCPHLDALLDACPSPVLLCLSTDADLDSDTVEHALRRGTLIYDYIDVVDQSVSAGVLSDERIRLHRRLLENEAILCLASSRDLLADVSAHRNTGFALVENAVDFDHFQVERALSSLDGRLHDLVKSGRRIVGFYGSFASWIDYDLICAAAARLPDHAFVLIGADHDGSRSALMRAPPNVAVFDAIHYAELPQVAAWFDVGLLPFKINALTNAVSPLKLFEYLALGLPVVSTPMPEAQRCQGILIADGDEAFAMAIETAVLSSGEPNAQRARRDLARQNDWRARAVEIKRLIAASRAPVEHVPATHQAR